MKQVSYTIHDLKKYNNSHLTDIISDNAIKLYKGGYATPGLVAKYGAISNGVVTICEKNIVAWNKSFALSLDMK
ncbi:MAG UNVERIFIED_CONTAM: hypothetical protein LVQ98_06785 [Rickettsiaceae bacterium]